MELARRTAFMLRAGDDAKRELAALDAPGPQLIPEPEPETATEAPELPLESSEPPLAPPADPKRRDRAVRRPERV